MVQVHLLEFTEAFALRRCGDIPWVWRSRREFTHMVVIIPGPKEPESMAPYMQELLTDLSTYGPSGAETT